MEIQTLQAELERLYTLDELLGLCRNVLGYTPDRVGGTTTLASFAGALVRHCYEHNSLGALGDAVASSRGRVHALFSELRVRALSQNEELQVGEQLGPYTIVRAFGAGRAGHSYQARLDGRDVRLKVLRRDAVRDEGALTSFLTVQRIAASLGNPGLPGGIRVEQIDDRTAVSCDLVDGQTLAAGLAKTGPVRVNQLKSLLAALLGALQVLHEHGIAHGALHLANVLLFRDDEGGHGVLLMDPGTDRLRIRPVKDVEVLQAPSTCAPLTTAAPEQLIGAPADPRSDVYSFGALLYEVVTGHPAFPGATALDVARGHFSGLPIPASQVAPPGSVGRDVDNFINELLAKDPAQRPASAAEVLDAFNALARASMYRGPVLTPDEIEDRRNLLIADPTDEDSALALEAAADSGADASHIAKAFVIAANRLDTEGDPSALALARSLMHRAAHLYSTAGDHNQAEQQYIWLLQLDINDQAALKALEKLRRKLGKHEELIELLLHVGQNAETRAERGRAMSEIGKLYAEELNDPGQALVAYARAFTENTKAAYAAEIEKLAASNQQAWAEVIDIFNDALGEAEVPPATRAELLTRAGNWYLDKLNRPDLALPCYQAVLETDAGNQKAVEGMVQVFRKQQQWPELGQVLLRFAEVASTPAQARNLRAEAADILVERLNDPVNARQLYEQVIHDDPAHVRATESLSRLYEQSGDYQALVKLLEGRAEALGGSERSAVQCRIAELYEVRLGDDGEAIRRLKAVLETDPECMEAYRALERLYAKGDRYKELLEMLEAELQIVSTPRLQVTLLERMASLYEEQFLDNAKAAEVLEKALRIDERYEPALAKLPRYYRTLDRWQDVASTYERHLALITEPARRLPLALQLGKVAAEQLKDVDFAISAYEMVLEAEPTHSGALEALAKLRESAGDSTAALEAIEALANKADSPEARASQWLRAARLLKGRGDLDGAVERYQRALDATPGNPQTAAELRRAYVDRGDAAAAVQLAEKELATTEGDLARARLSGEIADLHYTKLHDSHHAQLAAKTALGLDPANVNGHAVLGEIAFDEGRFVEAAAHLGAIVERHDTLPPEMAIRVLSRYMDAAARAGSTDKAMAASDALLRLAPDNCQALLRVTQVIFDHGDPKRAVELHYSLLERFAEELDLTTQALVSFRYGESLRRAGHTEEALQQLEEAADLDPSAAAPLKALAHLHADRGDWEQVLRIKNRHLDIADSDERIQLLLDMGEVAADKLHDTARASRSFSAALEEKPDDRRVLTRLMQLYSEEKNWDKLLDVVLRLAEFVDDPKQKAKYLSSAAMVCSRQLGDVSRAIGFYEQVIALDPSIEKAFTEVVELHRQRGDLQSVERLLQGKLDAATKSDNKVEQLRILTSLAKLYETEMNQIDLAVDAYEAVEKLDPDNKQWRDILGRLYSFDPDRYSLRAIAALEATLREDPYRVDTYKGMRKLYTDLRQADASWCVCQTLSVLGKAQPDEERFYTRMRADTAAPAQTVFTEDDWRDRIAHSQTDPLLTGLFASIEPAVIAARAQPLESFGFNPSQALDLASHERPMPQTLYYAAGVLGMSPPPSFENPNDQGGLGFIHSRQPAIGLGRVALSRRVPPQAAAFIAARHLTFYRPGTYLRHLMPTLTALKAWLFGAIKMVSPGFPGAPDVQGPMEEARRALELQVQGQARDTMSSIVSKLLQQGGSLDLKKWIAGVDLTADRVGLIVAHDLATALELVRASDDGASVVPKAERERELIIYSVSHQYLEMRKRLGVAVDS